jgi:NADH:ubiquinone oxidoreductase subunit C
MITKAWWNQWFKEKTLEFKIQNEYRPFIKISPKDLKEVVKQLEKDEEFTHIITITGIDVGKDIELIYHLSFGRSVLSLRTMVPKSDLTLPSIIDILPGASIYEREVHDLLGVTFEGNPDLTPLLLPDKWPSDVHPLRREWPSDRLKRRLEDI